MSVTVDTSRLSPNVDQSGIEPHQPVQPARQPANLEPTLALSPASTVLQQSPLQLALERVRQTKPPLAHHDHDHTHSHSHIIAVDLDEFIHSLKIILDCIQKGATQVWKELNEESQRWFKEALNAFAHVVAPHGKTDYGLTGGITLVAGALSWVANHGGVEEAQHAKHHAKHLAHDLSHAQGQLEQLKALRSLSRQMGARDQALVIEQQFTRFLAQADLLCQDQRFAQQQNKAAGRIGVATYTSARFIAASVVNKFVLQTALVAAAKSFEVIKTDAVLEQSWARNWAIGAGVLQTEVLAPGAGVAAAVLGGFFVHKAWLKRRQIQNDQARALQDIKHVQERLPTTAEDSSLVLQRYAGRVQKSGGNAIAFFGAWALGCGVFKGGSGLYAVAASSKAAQAGLAWAGVKVPSHPVVLAVLLVAAAVGGLVMGAGSLQFFTGHPKQAEFDERFLAADHPRLDRSLLVSADLASSAVFAPHALVDPELTPDLHPGLMLRAQLSRALAHENQGREDFLSEIAEDLKLVHVRTKDASKPHASRTNSKRDRVKSMFPGQSLSETKLAQWLEKPENKVRAGEWMGEQLQMHQTYLHQRQKVRTDMNAGTQPFEAHLQAMARTHPGDVSAQEAIRTAQGLLQKEAHNDAKDHVLELDLKALIEDLSHPSLSLGLTPANMGLLQDRFMALQQGEPDPRKTQKLDLEKANAQLARFMLKTAPGQHANLSQLQNETAHQASRLMAAAAKYPSEWSGGVTVTGLLRPSDHHTA